MAEAGHIELDRQIDSIVVGHRYREDLGDLEALMRSIEQIGLLQPITVTPDGVLVCGRRRLEAVRRLGWRTLRVWVRSGISDRLSELLAQQDENTLREPLSPLEATQLYLELKALYAEEAARRQAATQFGGCSAAEGGPAGEGPAAHGAAPAGRSSTGAAAAAGTSRGDGDSRTQAARTITGDRSYNRFERIAWLERVTADPTRSPAIRQLATEALSEIEAGAPVNPGYDRVKAAIDVAATEEDSEPREDLGALAEAALARVRQEQSRRGLRSLQRTRSSTPRYRTVRSFLLTWTELEGWSEHYDVANLAAALTGEDLDRFEQVVAETVTFAERLRAACENSANEAPVIPRAFPA